MLQRELLAKAAIALTPYRLSVAELLLDALVHLPALVAPEGADLQLRLHLGRSSHRALDRHHLAKVDCFEVPDRVHVRQIVDANLVPLRVIDLVPLVRQKLSQSLAHVRLEPHILALQPVDELGVFPVRVPAQMREVDVHRLLLLDFELSGDFDIVLDLLSLASPSL